MEVTFNIPAIVGNEREYIERVLEKRALSGDGEFTKKCSHLMEERFKAAKILLTTSGTHALDMASILLNLREGDEVIAPSYTFSSTVNSFMLRGAKPAFVDVREDTLNIDETQIEGKITEKTRAIYPVHYAGVACEMDEIRRTAKKHRLPIVEDAAHGVNAKYKDKYLGTIGDFGAYSFHETKNYVCGEGGALVVNDKRHIERAEVIWEKGTNRRKFFRGEIDKYTWIDIGSSYLPSEILAAYLYAQLENIERIQERRRGIYERYYENLRGLEEAGKLRLPVVPPDCTTNHHLFHILLPDEKTRDGLMKHLRGRGVHSVFHYLPLHLSPMGRKLGYRRGDLPNTEELSGRLLRLPFYYDLGFEEQEYVVEGIREYL